jgi:hypothetical protein
MRQKEMRVSLCLFLLLVALSAFGQQVATNNATVVPPMVNFSGTLKDINGKPLTGVVGVTFSLYEDEQAVSPLWMETQNVTPDKYGHYTVQLGATSSTGLPSDIFVGGEARWLGVRPAGQQEYPRVLLLSVPYALKAGDAQTLGGLPASAFMLVAPTNGAAPTALNSRAANASTAAPSTMSNVTTTGGIVNGIPLFTTATDIQNSAITQTGTGTTARIGIGTATPAATLDVKGAATVRGVLALPPIAVATKTTGSNSQPVNLVASSFSGSTSTPVNQTFQWQAESAGNDTANPSGTLNLLYGLGATKPSETGLHIASNGQISFATGQTFPGTGTGDGTITGVTAGAALTGGGTSGSVTLNVDTTKVVTSIQAGTGLTGGGTGGTQTLSLDTTKVPLLTAINTFTGNQTVNGNLSATGTVTGNAFNIGSNLFAFGSYNNSNAFLGFAGNTNMTGGGNTGTGYLAFVSNTMGTYNTANGYAALIANTTGGNNTASGEEALPFNTSGVYNTGNGDSALYYNTSGGYNTGVGAWSGFTWDGTYMTGSNNTFVGYNTYAGTGTLTNATAIGANAMVTASNAMVLGSINGVNGATASTNVGIGTTAPGSPLEVHGQLATLQNFGAPIAGIGLNAPPNSGYSAGIAILAQGGADDDVNTLGGGGDGIVALGGEGYGGGGSGVFAVGGRGLSGESGAGGYFEGGTGAAYGDGIVAFAGTGLAGQFYGDVFVNGNLSKSGGSFKIDHPLDPGNKYLYHSFVESPDMMNIYNGNVTLDADGGATIQMPDWFGVLNREFRYQLTSIGGFAPVYVAEELTNNQFKIGGGKPGLKVSWQITGIRQDAWANAHRIPVEEEKDDRLKGFYIHPELYGETEEKQIEWARHPSNMRRMKQHQQKIEDERNHPSTLRPFPPSSPLLPARRPPLPGVRNLGKGKRSP